MEDEVVNILKYDKAAIPSLGEVTSLSYY